MDLPTKMFSKAEGAEVTNHKGERIGTVSEVKKDSTGKKIDYIIVCSNELFGDGNRYFAVPACSSLIEMTREGHVLLYVDKDSLQVSIGVHARDCPKINPEFSDSILELYRYESSKTPALEMAGESFDDEKQYAH